MQGGHKLPKSKAHLGLAAASLLLLVKTGYDEIPLRALWCIFFFFFFFFLSENSAKANSEEGRWAGGETKKSGVEIMQKLGADNAEKFPFTTAENWPDPFVDRQKSRCPQQQQQQQQQPISSDLTDAMLRELKAISDVS